MHGQDWDRLAKKPKTAASPSECRQKALGEMCRAYHYLVVKSPLQKEAALRDGDVILFVCSFVCLSPCVTVGGGGLSRRPLQGFSQT